MYLLDTHYLIWLLYEPQKLSAKLTKIIENPDNDIFFSAMSIFEITIKESIGKLNVAPDFAHHLEESGLQSLPFLADHANWLRTLTLDIHKDPFDRALIAQSVVEGINLVTKDKLILQYSKDLRNIKNL
ncbi:type II toxin-antitoxin system VapC family toxin [Cysteiniphilum halobium]|uniref:type II toxin-antitoxin system VapC family toxin n=1 Tax=Cysteiniphilum halobium TaxID=2219059 RepID=UPI000E6598A0|nr:type II toxin-antitoxin system VapC family toxin [Cysteiniphilum halobium]